MRPSITPPSHLPALGHELYLLLTQASRWHQAKKPHHKRAGAFLFRSYRMAAESAFSCRDESDFTVIKPLDGEEGVACPAGVMAPTRRPPPGPARVTRVRLYRSRGSHGVGVTCNGVTQVTRVTCRRSWIDKLAVATGTSEPSLPSICDAEVRWKSLLKGEWMISDNEWCMRPETRLLL